MSTSAPKRSEPAWPSPDMLERMGFVKCAGDPECTTWVNPTIFKDCLCSRHRRARPGRDASKGSGRPLAELRYAPRPQRRDRRDPMRSSSSPDPMR